MKPLAIILNVFWPGVGSLVLRKYGQGITQLVLFGIGLLLCFTLIGVIIGGPLMFVVWVWGIITAASSKDSPLTVVVQQQGASKP